MIIYVFQKSFKIVFKTDFSVHNLFEFMWAVGELKIDNMKSKIYSFK
jgi:hypothetical protein